MIIARRAEVLQIRLAAFQFNPIQSGLDSIESRPSRAANESNFLLLPSADLRGRLGFGCCGAVERAKH